MSLPVQATSPLPYAVVLAVLLALFWVRIPLAVQVSGVVLEVLLVAMMTPLGANVLVRAMESRLPATRTCTTPAPTTIVVLGAGFDHSPAGPDDYGALRLSGLQRLFTGVALWRQIPGAQMVVTGGGPGLPEAAPMADLAVRMGVPAADVRIEDRARTTWENARNVAKLSPPSPRRIWLVTSPLHMPRALGAFRAWGFDPCPWPSGVWRERFHWTPANFVPQGPAVRTAAIALHEMAGSIAYAVIEWRHADRARRTKDQTP